MSTVKLRFQRLLTRISVGQIRHGSGLETVGSTTAEPVPTREYNPLGSPSMI
jgi:hypothetical protein